MNLVKYLVIVLFFSTVYSEKISDRIHLNLYSSFEFEYLITEGGVGDRNASFDADLLDLVFNIQATERLRISTDITWEHGAASEDNRGNVAIEYAFSEYVFFNSLKVRAGKMFCNFGIYNEIHTAKPTFLTVKEPLSTNKNDKFGSDIRFYPRWVNGLAVTGQTFKGETNINYILQLTNGEQENTNPFEEDDNIQKAVNGRLLLDFPNDLQIGSSFYTDWLNKDSTDEKDHLLSYGGHLIWKPGNATWEFEYVQGSIANKDRNALTALVSYDVGTFPIPFVSVRWGYEPYFRYEYLDPDKNIDKNNAQLFVYGIRFQVASSAYWKIDFNTIEYNEMNSNYIGMNQTEIKSSIAVGF